MKLNEPRLTLMAGLALALNLPAPSDVCAANGAPKKVVTLVRAQTSTSPMPIPPRAASGRFNTNSRSGRERGTRGAATAARQWIGRRDSTNANGLAARAGACRSTSAGNALWRTAAA